MQLVAIVISLATTGVALVVFAGAVRQIVGIVRVGQPAVGRMDKPASRAVTLAREILGHSRMLQWGIVGAAHWFVMVGFITLFGTLITAYGQLFDPHFALPIIGHWTPYALFVEAVAATTGVGILTLILIRQFSHPRALGRKSRFSGSRFWQAYYVEYTIVGVVVCVLTLRGLEGALLHEQGWSLDFAFSYPLVAAFSGMSEGVLEGLVVFVASAKIVVSMAWFITIALNLTMGVAWHRFTSFPNIFFKRNADGRPALGALQPMYANGEPLDFANMADFDENTAIGASKVEDFSWKQLLDVTTCTECGRCQSACPAWNTEKPLSPKRLVMDIREHLYAKAPLLQNGAQSGELQIPDDYPEPLKSLATKSLVPEVITDDVLWSCTTCGACVYECPVDIEHVDMIVDMRRNQVMMESRFPREAIGMLNNVESTGNPWGMGESERAAWTKDLDIRVLSPGQTIPDDVEYLFWVGCAGALEDRAKKTTITIAQLLQRAEVGFAVFAGAERCTGDPARRIGNEFLFQELAKTNVEMLNGAGVRKIIAQCPHCFNTLAKEYPQYGGHYEVIHHSQLLSKLVADGRLVPNTPVTSHVTYHDPCYLARHNDVLTDPRRLITATGARQTEMHRCERRTFCCGAGGSRMWMEETIGKRVNHERIEEALEQNPDVVATGCPYCLVMLDDAIKDKQMKGLGEGVEVLDVSQVFARSLDSTPAAAATSHAPDEH